MNIQLLKLIDRTVALTATRVLPAANRRVGQSSKPRAILLIRPGGIGDAVLLVPMLQRLRQTWPNAVLTVLAERRNAAVFELSGLNLTVLRYDVPGEFLRALCGRYDVVIDSEQWYQLSALVARMVRAPHKIGFATNERMRLFNAPVPYCQDAYERLSFQQLLAPLDIAKEEVSAAQFLTVPAVERRFGRDLIERFSNGYVALFPGASIPERRWPVAAFHELACRFAKAGLGVVVVGGREDAAAGEQIADGCGSSLAGQTSLIQTAAVLKRAALLVSGDSGVLHIAVGLGVKTVSLFGPGIEVKWGPQGEGHRIINRHLSCSPCTCWGRTPTCPDKGICISSITVDEVHAAALQLLG